MGSMVKPRHLPGNQKTRTWLAAVAGIAVLERIALFLFYRPVTYNDSDAYRRLADLLTTGWMNYDGTRMPAYPVFMAWLGSDERVYAGQLLLGLLITLLFFFCGWQVSRKGWFAAVCAFAYTLNPQQVLVEADLLSETLTVFFIAVCLAGMAWLLKPGRRCRLWQAALAGLGIGAVAGLAALVRTLFVFLPVLLAITLMLLWQARLRMRLAAALSVVLAGMALVGLWINFIHTLFGSWSMDTMTGYHLMNHAGLYFEDVPDEYAAVRDTFIRYREAQRAETGHPGNAIWDAIPELMQVSGMGFIPLSDFLAKLSLQLIAHHPGEYLLTVAEGWVAFWKVPVHWSARPSAPAWGLTLQRILILLLRGLLFLINLAFIAGTLALFWKKTRQAHADEQLHVPAGGCALGGIHPAGVFGIWRQPALLAPRPDADPDRGDLVGNFLDELEEK